MDNFLQPHIANFLKLLIEPALAFHVMVGNGSSMVAEVHIKDLQVQVQGTLLKLLVFLLLVASANLVLGPLWVATLGTYVADY